MQAELLVQMVNMDQWVLEDFKVKEVLQDLQVLKVNQA